MEHSSPKKDSTEDRYLRRYDAITAAINSVRWIAAEVLIVLYHYNSNDVTIKNAILKISNDATIAVRANLIYNLKYVVSKDDELCRTIVNKYIDERIEAIDYSLSDYFFYIWLSRLEEVKWLITNILLYSESDDVHENIWRLLGFAAYYDTVWYKDIIQQLISGTIGNDKTRWWFVGALLEKLNEELRTNHKGNIVAITDMIVATIKWEDKKKENNEVDSIQRLSTYFLREEDFGVAWFVALYKSWFLKKIIDILPNHVGLHQYIIECLVDLMKTWCHDIEILKTLYLQHSVGAPIFIDALLADKVAYILDGYLSRYDTVNKDIQQWIVEVFDKWLESGYDSFYNLYHKYFLTGKLI